MEHINKSLSYTFDIFSSSFDSLITDQDIEKDYFNSAKIVDQFGKAYLPLFERLEFEYLNRQNKVRTLERASHIVNSRHSKI